MGELSSTDDDTKNKMIKEVLDQGSALSGLAAGAGAVIGSFMLPVVGTILGGLAGLFIGGLFGPSLDQLKAQIITKISDQVDADFESTVQPKISDVIQKRLKQAGDTIYSLLREYLITVSYTHLDVYKRQVLCLA